MRRDLNPQSSRAAALQAAATKRYSPRTQDSWYGSPSRVRTYSHGSKSLVRSPINRPGNVFAVSGRGLSEALLPRPLGCERHTSAGARANLSRCCGSNGSRIMLIPTSCGVRSPLRLLQDWQAATKLSQESDPPRLLGST